MTQLVELTDTTGPAAIEGADVTFVDCWADWCTNCKAMMPAYQAVAAANEDRAVFAKLNIDEANEFAGTLGLRGIPTLIAFKNGQRIGTLAGSQPKPLIEKWVNEMIGEKPKQKKEALEPLFLFLTLDAYR